MADFAIDGMAYEVLNYVRREKALHGFGDNVPGYEALARIAPVVSCLAYGHPEQPRRWLRRFRQRPWRCASCGTWWITEHYTDYANYDSGGAWRWVRLTGEAPMTPDEKAERREAVIQGMVAKGYSRERAEEVIDLVARVLFCSGGRFAADRDGTDG